MKLTALINGTRTGRRTTSLPLLLFGAFLALCFGGCDSTGKTQRQSFLLRIDEMVVTRTDFYNALEIAKTAYPFEALQNPEVMAKVKARLLKQLTEELILARRAQDLGIAVSDAELEKAVAHITEDYPEGVFEQTLLENAIPFDVWKARLKAGMLMEKVIERELMEKMVITPEEASAYYREHHQEEQEAEGDVALLKRLRREKAQKAYVDWMKALQQQYHIELNQDLWKEILK
ncbi:SurA N-terminal domain-containing protein [Desulfosudis oleivorans]|uniref:SurA domain n=1 Tax=Desulfosudis oleivorans (strain DSM 6200 / JCM 39069 / Hxd3) TaxID=96561 RepID=A9A0L0_DESOH|nr:SurA N-terminal domain-containing protein [Desulfosudis oleivorans]ABW67510.1 SurA domain [Desulfosudis oleivorans Hxd3]